jgi:hypothetical protein
LLCAWIILPVKLSSHVLNVREKTIMKGEFASYNRISGKYQHKLIDDENEVEEVLLVRGNWRAELFSKMARRYMSRAMNLK